MDDDGTKQSLLLKMQNPDEETRAQAWEKFSTRYGPKIFRWAKSFFKDEHTARDVAQEVAVQVWQTFDAGWQYNPDQSFRGWLRTVTRNAAKTAIRNQRKMRAAGGTANLEFFNEKKTADELVVRLDDEHERIVLQRAKDRVKPCVNPKHWEVYQMRQEDCSLQEVSQELDVTYDNAKMICHRVAQKVVREAERLNGQMLRDNGGGHAKSPQL